MDIEEMQQRAVEVRARFAVFEEASYEQAWSTQDVVMGLMTDVGDLSAIMYRLEGRRPLRDGDPKEELAHELSDCLWVLLVLADRYGVEMGASFASSGFWGDGVHSSHAVDPTTPTRQKHG